MATPARVNYLNPQTLYIAMVIVAMLLFFATAVGIITLTDKQNKSLVEYEFRTLLQANGELLKKASNREFAQKITFEDQNFFLRVNNIIKPQRFETGNNLLEYRGQCISEKYLEFDLDFCRPRLIPWDFLKMVTALFLIMMFVALAVLYRMNATIVMSFCNLFQVASIPYPEALNFSKAWQIANEMAEHFQKFRRQSIDFEKNKAVLEISKQVAHDIRAPMSALNIVVHSLENISGEKRQLISNAIQRINDIADDLLKREKRKLLAENLLEKLSVPNSTSLPKNTTVNTAALATILNNVVSEKKILCQHNSKICLFTNIQGGENFFVTCNEAELSRIISNVINNSIEAIVEESISITVGLRVYRSQVLIVVQDNGKGIPDLILAVLGQEGITFGKNGSVSGSGLGVFHAKKTVEGWGGSFNIQSKLGVGTLVEIKLPRLSMPNSKIAASEIN